MLYKMYSMFIDNYLIKFDIDRDEDEFIFKGRVEYIYKNIKNLDNKTEEIINKIILESLILKNKLLYNSTY
jgi:hypothetical protein